MWWDINKMHILTILVVVTMIHKAIDSPFERRCQILLQALIVCPMLFVCD